MAESSNVTPDDFPADTGTTDSADSASGGQATTLKFGPFTVDRTRGLLLRDGRDVHLPPKALDVLLCLLERPGAVISKEDLIGRVWADIAVTDASLTETVRTLRNALGDDSRQPTFVQTVHRRGYRFIAALRPDGDDIPSAGMVPAIGSVPSAGPAAGAREHAIHGGRRNLGMLAVFVLGAIAGVWGLTLLGSQGRPAGAAASDSGQTAKLYVGAVGRSAMVYRYEIGIDGTAALDLTLDHGTFDLPGFFAFSPAGEMFVVNNRGGVDNRGSVTRFVDPLGIMPVFNGSIESGDFASPHWATFRGEELFIGQSEGDILRFLLVGGVAVPNGTMPGAAGVVRVNPATGELFIPQRNPDRIERYFVDASGNAVSNGIITGGGLFTPHDLAFNQRGELFVVNGFGNSVSRFVFDAAGNASPNGVITEGSLNIPLGIAFSPWGEMFVANRNDGWIHRWAFDSSFHASFNGSFRHPGGIHDLRFAPAPLRVARREP